MRILFLGNNHLALLALRWLKEQNEQVCGLVVHPQVRQKHGQEIVEAADLSPESVFDGSRLREPAVVDHIRALKPDLGISVSFGYIVQSDLLRVLRLGCINLHTGFLPYNRGAYPNVWSIVDATPAGVTLHYMDEGIDTGPIIAQKEIVVEPVDTGASLYQKLELQALGLLKSAWQSIKAGNPSTVAQATGAATHHRARDVEKVDKIDLDRSYRARDLINVLRARTFPPYPGAYFTVDGRRVQIRVELSYVDGEDESES